MISDVGRRMIQSACRFAGTQVALQGMIFDYSGKVLYDFLSIRAFISAYGRFMTDSHLYRILQKSLL